MPAFVQLALLSGVALCVALLLQKVNNNKETTAEGAAGHFPPMLHRKVAPEPARASGGHFSRAHNTEAIARAKGGTAAGGKSNLAGQIIPVYGFGILLYILYIIFKITSKGKTSKPHESRFSTVRSENMKRKITDFELTQLQDRLKETEEVMERIVSRAQAQRCSPDRLGPVSMEQEEVLLLQLREITRVMQESRLMDGFPPEQEVMDPQRQQDLEDDADGTVNPEEASEWHQHCCQHHQHQTCRSEHRETGGGEGLADGGNHPTREDSDDCAHIEEDEELARQVMKAFEAFPAAEEAIFPEPSPEHEEPSRNAACSGTSLIRRKTRSEAVRGT